MRKTIVVAIAVCLSLVVGPAEAARKFERGADFAGERGSCGVTTRKGNAVVTCDLDQGARLRYRFRLPVGASHVGVKWDRGHRGCCGFVDVGNTRWGAQRRHLVAEAWVRNYGNPLGSYKGIIRGAELRFWSTRP